MIDRSTKVYGSQVKQKIRATEASFFYKKKKKIKNLDISPHNLEFWLILWVLNKH
jgi:hypothetical protein